MKTSIKPLGKTLLLTLAIASVPALAGGPATTGALATPANRIVGTWSNSTYTTTCGQTPPATPNAFQTIVFSAGGTFLDNPQFSPSGITTTAGVRQRSIGVGIWDYDPATREYTVDQRFDWYLNGSYDGYQTVHRSIVLASNGNTISGPVLTIRYDKFGNQLGAQNCGRAVSTRI